MKLIDGAFGTVFGHALYRIVVGPAIVTIKIALPFCKQVRNDRAQCIAVPTRLEIGRAPALPGPNGVKLLVFLPCHRHRIGLLRVNRLRQHFLGHRFELGCCFRFVKNLMELLIYAERLGGTSCLKILLNFCHVASSLKSIKRTSAYSKISHDCGKELLLTTIRSAESTGSSRRRQPLQSKVNKRRE